MRRTVLVAGRSGQVARGVAEAHPGVNLSVIALGRPQLDLLSAASIEAAFEAAQPDIVINAAAYTGVDDAESDAGAAFALNATAAGDLAATAARRSVPIIHLSTDYVFDGSLERPYRETDRPAPLGVYGASKFAGEQAVEGENPDHLILRTAWVYSPFARNFVTTMLRAASVRDEVRVVRDQIGNPTNAADIAAALLTLCGAILTGQKSLEPGIFHLAGTGEASWAGFAEAIFRESADAGGPAARVTPIPSSDWPSPAPRPANSRLDGTRIKEAYGIVMPNWQASLRPCVQRLIRTGEWKE